MNDASTEAATVGCTQCGGTIALADLVSDVSCPFCSTVQRLDPRWLDLAQQYAQVVRLHVNDFERSSKDAAVAKKSTDPVFVMIASGLALAMLLMTGLLLFVFLGYLSDARSTSATKVEPSAEVGREDSPTDSEWSGETVFALVVGIPLFVLLASLCIGAAVSATRERRALRSHRTLPPPKSMVAPKELTCPTCGAREELTTGLATRQCSHCGGSLAATISHMADSVWRLVVEARRHAAAIRAPGPYWRRTRAFARTCQLRVAFNNSQRWVGAQTLESWLGGRGRWSRDGWLAVFWPEEAPRLGPTTFVCGYSQGYPVAVEVLIVSNRHNRYTAVKIYVAALALPSEGTTSGNRSMAGYHHEGWLSSHPDPAERISWLIRGLCGQAQRDGSPPAPFLAPSRDPDHAG